MNTSSSKLKLRDAVLEDSDSLFNISLSVHRQYYTPLIPAQRIGNFYRKYTNTAKNRQHFLEHLKNKALNPGGLTIAATIDNRIVGYVQITIQERDPALLSSLFVLPEFHGQGIGRTLLGAALKRTHDQPLELFVITTNAAAIHLYESVGFVKVPMDQPKKFYDATLQCMLLTRK